MPSLRQQSVALRRRLAYAGRHFTPSWRYGFNLKATLAYRREQATLTGEAARVLAELNRNGIALSSVDALLEQRANFAELLRAVEQLEGEWAGRIETERRLAATHDPARKTFILQLLGDHPRLDPNSIFARFALQSPLLQIANAYFAMYTRLRFYNVWHTLKTDAPARESQLWHRDREDHLIVKLFVYLSDVDAGAGPFTYAPGTHRKGAIKRAPAAFDENGVQRTADEQMAAVVPANRWITATGRRGTIVFADTGGFHKGGLARTQDRLLYTCLFTSPTSQAPELFTIDGRIELPADKAQAMALSRP